MIERRELRHDLRQLQGVSHRLTQDNTRLQHKLNTIDQRRLSPETPKALGSATPRELKKLRYEVAKLTETLREKEDEAQRLMAIVTAYEVQTTDPACDVTENPNVLPPGPELPSLDLNGKTVVLIGGLAKASVHYKQVIMRLGGSCIRHDGTVNQGHKRLVKVIRQADMVFCPVDCVSHGTASSAKKLCRAFDKPCYFLRSSGVSHIREKLREVALQP